MTQKVERAVHDPHQNLCSAIIILCTCTSPVHAHVHAHAQVCILRMHFSILCNVELHLWFTSWYHQINHLWLSCVLAFFLARDRRLCENGSSSDTGVHGGGSRTDRCRDLYLQKVGVYHIQLTLASAGVRMQL